jgi:2-polyprenyl-6-methoxyphenol hydroxylase-like FAD-dependent oxidoreductase
MVATGGRCVTARPDVLVVGAGPTGLATALCAYDHGATVRIVERRPAAFRPSRALILHARTLEVLRPAGVVEALLDRADIAPRALLRLGTRTVPVTLAGFDWRDTQFAHLTLIRQMEVENVLAGALGDRGVAIERGTELVGMRDVGPVDGVSVSLRTLSGTALAGCRFLVGCDGAGSTVRGLARIGWQGRPYREEIVLADLELSCDLPPGVAHVVAGRRGVLFIFAQGERATWRLLATRPAVDAPEAVVGRDELQRLLDDAGLPARISAVGWSERVRVQHRIASRYRQGNVFLAGDAAHTHSPAAAQGLNTGIQDAANLGWKLAFAPYSSAAAAVLGSYGQERRPVARRVVALTHLAFWAEAGTGPAASFLRGILAPLAAPVMPTVLRRGRAVARVGRVLSQLDTGYPDGALAVDDGPPWPRGPRAGERVPDAMVTCGGRRLSLHRLLGCPGVHVLLPRDSHEPDLRLRAPFGHVHRLTDTPGSGVLVVRPDGHVGYRSATVDDGRLGAWLAAAGALR